MSPPCMDWLNPMETTLIFLKPTQFTHFQLAIFFLAWVESGRDIRRTTEQGAEGIEDYCEDGSASLLRSPKCSTTPGLKVEGFFELWWDWSSSMSVFCWALLLRWSKNWQVLVRISSRLWKHVDLPIQGIQGARHIRGEALAFLVLTILETKNMLKVIPRKNKTSSWGLCITFGRGRRLNLEHKESSIWNTKTGQLLAQIRTQRWLNLEHIHFMLFANL